MTVITQVWLLPTEKVWSSGSAEKVRSSGSAEKVQSSGSAEKVRSSGSAGKVRSSGSAEKVLYSGTMLEKQGMWRRIKRILVYWMRMTRMTGTTASISCNLCSESMFTCVDHTNNCNNRLCNVNTAFIIHWPIVIHPLWPSTSQVLDVRRVNRNRQHPCIIHVHATSDSLSDCSLYHLIISPIASPTILLQSSVLSDFSRGSNTHASDHPHPLHHWIKFCPHGPIAAVKINVLC